MGERMGWGRYVGGGEREGGVVGRGVGKSREEW